MSESKAFANYSNTARQLQAGAGQQQAGRLMKDTIDDAANFEQQFLIGMAVHQKAKVGEQLTKFFKGSKTLQKATGLSEDELSDIAGGDFSGLTGKVANGMSKKLQQSIQGFKDAKDAKNASEITSKAARDLAQAKQQVSDRLSDARDAANDAKDAAQSAANDADAEVSRLSNLSRGDGAAMRQTASNLRDTADSAQADADAAKDAASKVSKTRPTGDVDEDRIEPNPDYDDAVNDALDKQRIASDAAKSATEAEDAASTQEGLEGQIATAGRASFKAAQTLASKTAAAEGAEGDADAAAGEAGAAAEGAAGADVTAAATGAKLAKAGADADKLAEGALAESEFDPLGLIVAGIGALAATLIGRKIKTHEAVNVAPAVIQSSYSTTLGA
tara:strand:+ start:969 stop:2135 length:1167 start_codon:yes stop_codon:yes gene_type:complete